MTMVARVRATLVAADPAEDHAALACRLMRVEARVAAAIRIRKRHAVVMPRAPDGAEGRRDVAPHGDEVLVADVPVMRAQDEAVPHTRGAARLTEHDSGDHDCGSRSAASRVSMAARAPSSAWSFCSVQCPAHHPRFAALYSVDANG